MLQAEDVRPAIAEVLAGASNADGAAEVVVVTVVVEFAAATIVCTLDACTATAECGVVVSSVVEVEGVVAVAIANIACADS